MLRIVKKNIAFASQTYMKKLLLCLLLIVPMLLFGQEKQLYKIGILTDVYQPDLVPLLEELKNDVISVVGEDAQIEFPDEYFMSNDLNLEAARSNYMKLLESDVDIIIAFGLVNNAVMISQDSFPKPTILFGAVNNDFLNIDKEAQSTGVENFTFLITSRSYISDLATFYELTSFKKLGIVIQEPFMDVYPYEDLFDEEFDKYEAEYELISYNDIDDILESLEGIDALYLAEGFYLTSEEIQVIADACVALKIPSFTSMRIDDVRNGILATNQAEENLNQFFRRIALTVESYIEGKSLADSPVYISFDTNLTINYNTAERIRLPLKYSLIAQTDFIGDFDEKLSDKK